MHSESMPAVVMSTGVRRHAVPRLPTRWKAEVGVLLSFLIRHKNCLLNPSPKSPRAACRPLLTVFTVASPILFLRVVRF